MLLGVIRNMDLGDFKEDQSLGNLEIIELKGKETT